jgi:hypothetical protein
MASRDHRLLSTSSGLLSLAIVSPRVEKYQASSIPIPSGHSSVQRNGFWFSLFRWAGSGPSSRSFLLRLAASHVALVCSKSPSPICPSLSCARPWSRPAFAPLCPRSPPAPWLRPRLGLMPTAWRCHRRRLRHSLCCWMGICSSLVVRVSYSLFSC